MNYISMGGLDLPPDVGLENIHTRIYDVLFVKNGEYQCFNANTCKQNDSNMNYKYCMVVFWRIIL